MPTVPYPTVNPGQTIVSAHHNALADPLNGTTPGRANLVLHDSATDPTISAKNVNAAGSALLVQSSGGVTALQVLATGDVKMPLLIADTSANQLPKLTVVEDGSPSTLGLGASVYRPHIMVVMRNTARPVKTWVYIQSINTDYTTADAGYEVGSDGKRMRRSAAIFIQTQSERDNGGDASAFTIANYGRGNGITIVNDQAQEQGGPYGLTVPNYCQARTASFGIETYTTGYGTTIDCQSRGAGATLMVGVGTVSTTTQNNTQLGTVPFGQGGATLGTTGTEYSDGARFYPYGATVSTGTGFLVGSENFDKISAIRVSCVTSAVAYYSNHYDTHSVMLNGTTRIAQSQQGNTANGASSKTNLRMITRDSTINIVGPEILFGYQTVNTGSYGPSNADVFYGSVTGILTAQTGGPPATAASGAVAIMVKPAAADANMTIAVFCTGTAGNAQVGINRGTASYNLDVNGTFGLSGAATLSSTLGVTGTSTFTGKSTHNGGVDISGDLTFLSTSRRILADFSNATFTSRTSLKTSTANGATNVGVLPNGSSTTAAMWLFNEATPTNCGAMTFGMQATFSYIDTTKLGSGTTRDLYFLKEGALQLYMEAATGQLVFSNGQVVAPSSGAAAAIGLLPAGAAGTFRGWLKFKDAGAACIMAVWNG
ncbi:MAG: hypothetical protein ACRDGM_18060 [bacterium]